MKSKKFFKKLPCVILAVLLAFVLLFVNMSSFNLSFLSKANKDKKYSDQDNPQSSVLESEYEVNVTKTSSWEQDDKHFYQLEVTICNNGEKPISDWLLEMPVNADSSLEQSWSANYNLVSSNLAMTPLDWNSTISAKGSVDFGFIISTMDEFEDYSTKLTVNDIVYSSNISSVVDEKIEVNDTNIALTPYSIDAQAVNSWYTGSEYFTQIQVVFTNKGSSTIKDWQINLDLDDTAKLSQGWNSNYEISGSKILITPDANNKKLNPNESTTVGFIVCGSKEYKELITKVFINGNEVSCDGNIVGDSTEVTTESTTEVTTKQPTEATTEVTTKQPTEATTEVTTKQSTEATTEVDPDDQEGDSDFSKVTNTTVSVKRNNSWTQDSKNYYQFEVTITNGGSTTVTGWNVSMDIPEDTELSQGWNANFEIVDDVINISADANSMEIAPQSTKSCGFIICTPNEYVGGTESISGSTINGGSSTTESQSTQGGTTEVIDPIDPIETDGTTPVDKHGQLSVSGTQIVDENGNPFVLRGVSTHGLAWFPGYVNQQGFSDLQTSWNANVVRLALYSDPNAGFSDSMYSIVEEGVRYASEAGMYVIIDWHILSDNNPNTNKESAIKFFNTMSSLYKDYNNVIYEICNEPNGDVQWSRDIKPYAEDVIDVIRANDDNAIIIVGTPTWSQDVDVVANDPIEGETNIMYTLHFYAATHKDGLRNKLVTAHNLGLPVFVTEFGICESSGYGSNDYDSANTWIDLLESYNISYVAWNLSNKNETCALLNSSCSKYSGWENSDLTDYGKWYVNILRTKNIK